jgi:hypothetical protein
VPDSNTDIEQRWQEDVDRADIAEEALRIITGGDQELIKAVIKQATESLHKVPNGVAS